MSEPQVLSHEIDKVKSMPRKELNAECLHLMREQVELTQDLHTMKTAYNEAVAVMERIFSQYRGLGSDAIMMSGIARDFLAKHKEAAE